MKKLLLALLVVVFFIPAKAQSDYAKKESFLSVKKNKKNTPDVEKPYLKISSQVVENRDADIVVGNTRFDVQSYGSSPRHIWTWPDGTKSVVWTMGLDDGYPDRGTGYNYYNGVQWGPIPDTRIENDRTGWSEISNYGENGEVVAAHAYPTGNILFSYRDTKGEGEWQYFTLEQPTGLKNFKSEKGGPELVWPRICVTGEDNKTVHVLCMYGWGGFEYEGLKSALVYSRTTDGGQTWDPYMEILDGMTSDDYNGAGADEYGWAIPKGDTIAFVMFNGITDGFVMKSTDGGDTWEKITFYESPDPFFDGNSGDLPRCGGGDGNNAIAFDKDGKVHVVFGRQIHIDDTPDDNTWSFYPYSDGLVYWNETMEPLDTADITNDPLPLNWENHPLYLNGQLAAYTFNDGNSGEEGDSIAGVADYYCSLTGMPQLDITYDETGNGIINIIYSGLALGSINDEFNLNYRHLFHTYSEMDNKWSVPQDLTNDVFHIASECVFPSFMSVNDSLHITYQTSSIPGIAGYGTHDPVLNNIVYLPVSPLPTDVKQNKLTDLTVSQNRPNPAINMTKIDVKVPKGKVEMIVTNTLGQTVYHSEKISNGSLMSFSINVSDFTKGVYFYTVKYGENSVTKKMIVN